jgi:hypothetical protein
MVRAGCSRQGEPMLYYVRSLLIVNWTDHRIIVVPGKFWSVWKYPAYTELLAVAVFAFPDRLFLDSCTMAAWTVFLRGKSGFGAYYLRCIGQYGVQA